MSGTQGFVSSIQTLGTLDGPGVRFAVFLQGCNLRCSCCHNPETWRIATLNQPYNGENERVSVFGASELANRAERYRSYFGADGGVTLTGGEPLVQAQFAFEFFSECKRRGLGTCLDTSGSIMNSQVEKVLSVTDRVLLDIKYHSDVLYKQHVGCSIDATLRFLDELERRNIPVTLRQVLIPSLNDCAENKEFLSSLIRDYKCIDKVEILPFRKICQVKYDRMGVQFPFADMETPSADIVKEFQSELDECLKNR
ncbi:MAG: radical SAM protein [Clostridia bacterium]|nr:radical SAM protein [Clostridia bacterium]